MPSCGNQLEIISDMRPGFCACNFHSVRTRFKALIPLERSKYVYAFTLGKKLLLSSWM